ncbi:uncharacterized protein C4orf19-like isoform X1 [Salvelinus fontinalis]|uniref:uncharacterized protein C4orf19-like isoform X1 n=1 Tax=Salvelinus fontinalis TaxID=8038 RepID=UPI0024856175|nr:uncharacterized protein C4orf19-like isoform X1 [Salvelinus fontinalis]XP_055756363.1 uncharacterized protein C4orf19-like isoform X1 [Salvelinus fontinalis]
MGCQCCKMIKRNRDPAESSLYQPHHLPADNGDQSNNKQKQVFHNLGFSYSNKHDDGEDGGGLGLKLEIDNNQINRLHAVPANPERGQGVKPWAGEGGGSGGGGLYILHPEGQVPRRDPSKGPSQVPIYPNTLSLDHSHHLTHLGDNDSHKIRMFRNSSDPSWPGVRCYTSLTDELDEGVGGTPEYVCDTGDEESVLSADIPTSTTSLSSADTKDDRRAPDATTVESGSGISVMKSEDEGREEDDVHHVIDSLVAEALAALDAATAGEDCED